jgi:PiT family inorganic phosphate transporter
MTIALLIVVLWLAYSNGANDNLKGVATLYGSGTATFNRARLWATATTLAGSLASVVLAASLVKQFSGSGLVSVESADSPALLVAVGAAGAATVLLATVLGMPTSTTHALTGALAGIALVAGGGVVAAAPLGKMWTSFFLPMLASPAIAVVLAGGAYLALRRLRLAMGITRETCVCIGPSRAPVPASLAVGADGPSPASTLADPAPGGPSLAFDQTSRCLERYAGSFIGVDAQTMITAVHFASAGAVCFARALNDTPKITALLLAGGATSRWHVVLLGGVAAANLLGGLVQSRAVAETVSRRITPLNPGQGLTGNLVTALLVIGASVFGVPVSTTHVSVGSIFGIGLAGGRPRWKTIAQIALAWLTTLPLGAVLGAGVYLVLTRTPAAFPP